VYIEVDTPLIRNHAKELTQLQANVTSAADAVETTIDPLAFGVINGFLAVGATALLSVFKSVVSGQASSLGETATTLLAMADTHDSNDDDASSAVKKAGR
jgi:ABC-type transporter Mla subunit MlaD